MNEQYINKEYSDGDKDISIPYWKDVIQKEIIDSKKQNTSREMEKTVFISEDEIALKHPVTGATIKLRDDGSIEMFVNEDTGIRLDPIDNAITFFGDSVHVATKEMRIHTKPQGFIWNNHNINPYLYYGDKDEDGRHIPRVSTVTRAGQGVEETASSVPIFQEQKRKQYYDKTTQNLMHDIGIDFSIERR